jgi:hypothetical protein
MRRLFIVCYIYHIIPKNQSVEARQSGHLAFISHQFRGVG